MPWEFDYEDDDGLEVCTCGSLDEEHEEGQDDGNWYCPKDPEHSQYKRPKQERKKMEISKKQRKVLIDIIKENTIKFAKENGFIEKAKAPTVLDKKGQELQKALVRLNKSEGRNTRYLVLKEVTEILYGKEIPIEETTAGGARPEVKFPGNMFAIVPTGGVADTGHNYPLDKVSIFLGAKGCRPGVALGGNGILGYGRIGQYYRPATNEEIEGITNEHLENTINLNKILVIQS